FKKADILAAFFEATQLAGFEAAEAKRYFGTPPKSLKVPRLTPLATADAQAQFLERFRRLSV
ncbi:MAG: HD family hydrolase, partial [Alphaproteobacteria bacterium]|nr:HD family hydrolase [Alphaproteobacteria bacterium]